MSGSFKIAVLPGDGIGKEVVDQALRILKSVQELVDGFSLSYHKFDCGGAYYANTGREWDEEAEKFVKEEADAVLLGAVGAEGSDGNPIRRPDGHLAGYSIVIGLRMDLDLYANVRPVELYEGVPTPLKVPSSDVKMTIIRENTEGLYAPARGGLDRKGEREIAIDNRIITKKGSRRVAEFAFELALKGSGAPEDEKKRVTCVDKSNLLAGCQLFRETFRQVAGSYPKVEADYAYVDAFAQWIVKNPAHYDVVVTPNEFGDILTDLGAALQGGLGMAPAGNIGESKGVFEPVHGSAPKYAGKNSVNPTAAILAASMMLEWLGEKYGNSKCIDAGRRIKHAVKAVLIEGKIRTFDLCVDKWDSISPASTSKMADAIIDQMKRQA